MRITTRYHDGNDAYRPILQNQEDMEHNNKSRTEANCQRIK